MLSNKYPTRMGFTLLELLVVIGIIAVLMGILLTALVAANQACLTADCTNNLRQLYLAVQLYQETMGFYPQENPQVQEGPSLVFSDGKLLFRTLLPYLEQTEIATYDPSGDAVYESNFIRYYICPLRRDFADAAVEGKTDYAGGNHLSSDSTGRTVLGGDYGINPAPRPWLQAQPSPQNWCQRDVASGDGTSCTLLLSHKALNPQKYIVPLALHTEGSEFTMYSERNDFGWRRMVAFTPHSAWPQHRVSTQFDHLRRPDMPALHDNATGACSLGMCVPGEESFQFGSVHPGAMPSLWADGHVTSITYKSTVENLNAWKNSWTFNDGQGE